MMWIEYNLGTPDRLSLAHARGYLRRAIRHFNDQPRVAWAQRLAPRGR